MSDKLKTVELVLLAISAVITAAKYLVRFIGYLCKLNKKKPAVVTA